MEALILILIGVITGLELGPSQPVTTDPKPDPLVSESTRMCQSRPNALWVANLEDPEAPRWLLRDDGALCEPVTGRVVVLEGFRYAEIH